MKYTLLIPWRDKSMTDLDTENAQLNGEKITTVFEERDALRARVAELEKKVKAADAYIEILERCQDGYYRVLESDEAKAYHS